MLYPGRYKGDQGVVCRKTCCKPRGGARHERAGSRSEKKRQEKRRRVNLVKLSGAQQDRRQEEQEGKRNKRSITGSAA